MTSLTTVILAKAQLKGILTNEQTVFTDNGFPKSSWVHAVFFSITQPLSLLLFLSELFWRLLLVSASHFKAMKCISISISCGVCLKCSIKSKVGNLCFLLKPLHSGETFVLLFNWQNWDHHQSFKQKPKASNLLLSIKCLRKDTALGQTALRLWYYKLGCDQIHPALSGASLVTAAATAWMHEIIVNYCFKQLKKSVGGFVYC